jgi:hypothetical protein
MKKPARSVITHGRASGQPCAARPGACPSPSIHIIDGVDVEDLGSDLMRKNLIDVYSREGRHRYLLRPKSRCVRPP